METIQQGLAFAGAVFIALILWSVLYSIYYKIKIKIRNILRKRSIKNRFNKKPTAACYCRDCYYFEPKTGGCYSGYNSQLMNPAWFCYFAAPLTGDSYEERDKQMKKLEEKQNG